MKKLLALLLCLCLLAVPAFAEDSRQISATDVLKAFLAEDYAAVHDMLSPAVQSAITPEQLGQAWQSQLSLLGSYVSIAGTEAAGSAEALLLRHERGAQSLITVRDEQGMLVSLLLQPATLPEETPRTLPEGASETDVRLFPGTEQELQGKIIVPEAPNAPYVLFVHGSGPSDMDSTLYGNRPFLDLAYDLAALGVGSIRFDKVTLRHPELPCDTVEQEYLIPVQEAYRVLRETTGAEQVFILGHSQGGMLMPWLVQACSANGGIALAGTPCAFWEVSLQQNLDLISLMPQDQQPLLRAQIDAERARAEALPGLSADEARQQTIFGVNGFYLQHMGSLDQIAIARETGMPMLFLHGSRDVQVSAPQHDAWLERLGESPLYTAITYPELNHLFMPAQPDENIGNVTTCYAIPAHVDARVAQDIAAWIASLE